MTTSRVTFRSTAWLGLVFLVTACGGNETGSAPAGGTGGGASSGAGGGGGAAMGAGGAASAAECALTFTFTTIDNGGRYSPSNVSAVWVTDAQNAFVKTLEENGYIRQVHLTAWEQAANGNTVDAVTGATNRSPRAHSATWDCSDVHHAPVPPGTYTINAEFATDNGSGFFGGVAPPLLQVPFQVGAGPQSIAPPDAQFFTGIGLTSP